MTHRSRAAACAALLSSLVLANSASAFETKHAPSGAAVRWKKSHVVWFLDPSLDDVEGAAKAFRAAGAAWSTKSGAPTMTVQTSTRPLTIGLDGTNGLFFVPDGYGPAGRALAVTIVNLDETSGEILDADIVLNGKYHLEAIAPNGKTAPATEDEHDASGGATYDVRRVAAHEMGHALGLSDEYANPEALMYPYVAPDTAQPASPGDDDLAGIDALYASAAGAPVVSTSSQPHGCGVVDRRPLAPRAVVVIALAALAVGLVRVRRRRGTVAAAGLMAAFVAAPPVLASTRAPGVGARAIVTGVRTFSDHGLLRSELDLATTACSGSVASCPSSFASPVMVWGGVQDGIRQEIGGHAVPSMGDRVAVTLDESGRPRAVRLVDE